MKAVYIFRILCICTILALSPFLLADRNSGAPAFNDARAEIGTCCSQQGAICVIPPLAVHNFYALPPG
ncbi:MAG: hypothetical protein U5K31_06775 [Balneolaceae bacterium]|nr:hypothetical protein [Balneolaceae bacterium]